MNRILTFDFGASSGRAMLAQVTDGKLVLSEIHRFDNTPLTQDGHLRWNLPVLISEIETAIKKAVEIGGFDAVGFDTWGVDFALIDNNGEVIEKPVHYRDSRCEIGAASAHQIVSKAELYKRTGIQYMNFNTVYQLHYLSRYEPVLLQKADKILLMADLFAYHLTGEMRLERTNASTTALLSAKTHSPDTDLMARLGIPERLLCRGIDAGETYGVICEHICAKTGCKAVPVIAVATHDTASAVVGVPTNEPTVYISCGTWSLMGIERLKSDIEDPTFTNEIGYGGCIRYLKNIMGLWIIQQTRQCYKMDGFAQMVALSMRAAPFACFVDVDDASFLPPGDMPERIRAYCRKTGQYVPKTQGEVIRCIYESLAMKYRYTFDLLSQKANQKFGVINMVGGGCNAELLCQMTASATGARVEAGPSEATAIGNAAVQLIAMGEIENLIKAREIIRASTPLKTYAPQDEQVWNTAYQKFLAVIKK